MAKRNKKARKPSTPQPTAESTHEAMSTGCMLPIETTHQIERDLQRELLAQPGLRFSSLVVRRIQSGVFCLEGVLEAGDSGEDVSSLARRVAGVEEVLNHLVVQHPPEKDRLLPLS